MEASTDREKEPFRLWKPTYKDGAGKVHRLAKWWIETRDHLRIVRRFPGVTDKAASAGLARQIVRLVACRMTGEQPGPDLTRWLEQVPAKLLSRFAAIGLLDGSRAAGMKPLRGHLADFYRALLDKGDTGRQARQVVIRAGKVLDGRGFIIWLADFCQSLLDKGDASLRFLTPKKARQLVAREAKVLDDCGFTVWSEIRADRIASYLAGLRESKDGISAQTSNFYLQAVKQFCRWMVQNRRASESPVVHLKGLNVKVDRRHDHVQLEVDEVRRLLAAAAAGPDREGMTGAERRLLYMLAVESGLRANELRTLTVGSFDLGACTVTVQAGYSKHRREDTLPLRRETAEELRAFLAGRLPGSKVFGGSWRKLTGQTAEIVRLDLEAAGIDYQDAAGRFRDFHALRHTCGSWLAACGVPLTTIRGVMRHGDLRVTSRYAHSMRGQEAQAVNNLPSLSLPSPESQQARATGTDCRLIDSTTEKLGAKLGAFPRASSDISCASVRDEVVENPAGADKNAIVERRRWESNPRITVLQTVALGHLATPPDYVLNSPSVYTPSVEGSRKFVEVLLLCRRRRAPPISHIGATWDYDEYSAAGS